MRKISLETKEMGYFELRHECFDRMEKFSGGRMRNLLQVKPPFEGRK